MRKLLIIFSFAFLLAHCKQEIAPGSAEFVKNVVTQVDDARLKNADQTPGDWLSYGRNYAEDHFSALNQITTENVSRLGLAWSIKLETKRGIEATPIVVNGIMYFSGPWSKVFAVDTRTGKMLWTFDPKVSGAYGEKACCDVVSRGVAMYKGLIFVGTLDGRLIAIDAASGSQTWSVQTTDTTKPYTITGAPRVVKGKVIIGNGGSDYGVRGFVTAYNAMTGKESWRFYTVPGDPSKPFESEALQAAVKTWNGNWWEYGGGGTAWDAMAFDPELNLVYVGTGNGAPWNRKYRSPDGGDNLYLCSILAINPDNGKLVWYYQTTPGEEWDYTSTQPLMLADLNINGEKRKTIMQAPKNGFFYVIDRTNGKLISAKPYVHVNWATGIDMATGRPIENPDARYQNDNVQISPPPLGGHNWQPMSYNPNTGLVYFTNRVLPTVFATNRNWKYNKPSGGFGSGIGWNTATGFDPTRKVIADSVVAKLAPGEKLIAWDPVKQEMAWSIPLNGFWNGGTLSTAGGLVFEGTADGKLVAADAKTGKIVWQKELGSGIIGTPVSYQVDGKQYVTIVAGWGGVFGLWHKFTNELHPGTVYTFALDSSAGMPEFPKQEPPKIIDLPFAASKTELQKGGDLYMQYCATCHSDIADGAGALPDLGFSSEAVQKIFKDIVLKGALVKEGMPNFGTRLTDKDATDIQNFILASAKSQIQKQKAAAMTKVE